MTITITKERLRTLLLAERGDEFMILCGSIDTEEHDRAQHVMREKYGNRWLLITDADLQKEAAESKESVAHRNLKEAAREVIRSQVDPVEDRTAAIERLARLVGTR